MDTFQYTVSDRKGGLAEGLVFVDVFKNILPVPVVDRVNTGIGRSVIIDVLGNDFDGDGEASPS